MKTTLLPEDEIVKEEVEMDDAQLLKVLIIVGIVIAAIILMVAAILLVQHRNRNAEK